MAQSVSLYLELRETTNADAFVGRLLLGDVEAHPSIQGVLVLNLEFFAQPTMQTDPPANWAAMSAKLHTTTSPAYTVGSVKIEHLQRPPFPPVPMNRQTSVQWIWELFPADVEAVERQRASADPSAPLYFSLHIRGIVDTPRGVLGVQGSGQIKIELSQWQRLLKSSGYTIGPSGLVALSNAVLEDNSWKEATRRLDPARSQLRRGSTHAALEQCLSQMEAFVTAPYTPSSWIKALGGQPEQKRTAIAAWMAGLATYLNRVGHHRDRGDRDSAGDLALMPAEHWEAELGVTATQMAIAYLLRLDPPLDS